MLKKMFLILLAGAMCLCLFPVNVRADAMHYPTETVYYDPGLSYGGLHLINQLNSYGTYLIDMDGRLVHKWMRPYNPAKSAESVVYATVEENGMLSREIKIAKPANVDPTISNLISGVGADGGLLEEVNWYGNVVRSWNTFTNQYYAHHRYERMYNNKLKAWTYLFQCYEPHTAAEAVAMGATGNVPSAGFATESLYEFDYSGNIVWKWSLFDHITQGADPAKPNYALDGNVFNSKNRLDINAVANTGRNVAQKDWHHSNSLGYDPKSGCIALNSREYDEFWVVKHDATFVSTTDWAANIAAAAGPDGDFAYRFGNPCLYNAPDFTVSGTTQHARPSFGNNGATQIWGAHGVNWIQPTAWRNGPAMAYGAGNIMILDNHGCNNNPLGTYTQLLEINPYVTGPYANGAYPTQASFKWPEDNVGYVKVATIGMGFGQINQSNQVVWKFRPQNDWGFSSAHISGAQRMANGNTIGTAGEAGHVIEVTRGTYTSSTSEANAGTSPQLAWEYQCPVYVKTLANGNKVNAFRKANDTAAMSEATQMFCSFRYSPNHPGLKNYVIQYSDGTIQPIQKQPGVGFTLTGAVPCRNVPCNYVGAP